MPRDYAKEYRNYQGTEEQKKKRASRNKARRNLMKSGSVRKGDGKDIHHKDRNPFNNSRKNLRITTQATNRSRKY